MTIVGGVAAALVAASPALAAGTWQVDSSSNPAGSTFSQLNAVFAASHTEAWAVDQTRVAASGDGFETLIEEWNGTTWSVVPGAPASASASSLSGVSGWGPSDIWAVGQNSSTSFIEHWNGQSWRLLIRDRGSNFTRSFDAVFEATGTTILRTAVRAPR
jgi:hypothetical protein